MKRLVFLLSCAALLAACSNCDDGEFDEEAEERTRRDSVTVAIR